jgi:hypothetical protein
VRKKKKREITITNKPERRERERRIVILLFHLLCVSDGKEAAQVFLLRRDGWHYI